MSDFIIPQFSPSTKTNKGRWSKAMSESNYTKQLAYYKQECEQGYYARVSATRDKYGDRTITLVLLSGESLVAFNERLDLQAQVDYYEELESLPHHAGDFQ